VRSLATKQPSSTAAKQKSIQAPPAVGFNPDANPSLLTVPYMLQRKLGCACGGGCPRCKSKLPIQTKLAVSEPGDIYEREADRIADQVMAAPAHTAMSGTPPRIQRFSGQLNGHMDVAPGSVDGVLASFGRPLDTTLRQDMEQRFGHDFSQVRVHSGAAAEQSARDVNANAYTVGHHMVFGAGQFAPGMLEGRRLIAHELTHVVQQSNQGGAHIQRYVPCEQPSLSLESCPPRKKGEIAESRTALMTVHDHTWLSDIGTSIYGYLIAGFEIGKSTIKRNLKDLQEWKDLVTYMQGSNIQWKIRGLSDCSGSPDRNESIRKARAEAVYSALPEEARKHVVAREAVPLRECMTGNQRKVDRTVNRSVMIEQVGKLVDIKPEEEETREANLPKFVCGPDVTRQVADAVRLAQSIFAGWNAGQRRDACEALVSFEGVSGKVTDKEAQAVGECSWDIYELHNNLWISSDFQPVCATTGAPGPKKCGESVQIDDDCHHAGGANYVIFGTMFKLCAAEDPMEFFEFSKSSMRSFIDLYKGSGPSGVGTPVKNFKSSMAWAIAGYDGWPAVESPEGDWNNCAPMCPLPYKRAAFKIHWHPHKSLYTCPSR
jgi:hypothetical protein